MKKLTLILVFLLLWTVACGPESAYADVPHLISYQGRLTDATTGEPVTGSCAITFRIYGTENAALGTHLWEETHQDVTIEEGIFGVLLGSEGNPIPNSVFTQNASCYLAIKITGEEEMTPRQQIASVGYAYKAEKAEHAEQADSATNADTVDGLHASATPEAGKLLTLNTNAKFSNAVLETTPITGFSSWVVSGPDFAYHADTDGFVVAYGQGDLGTEWYIEILTDSNNPPKTTRVKNGGCMIHATVSCPVKKGEYYKVQKSGQSQIFGVYWIPLSN